MKIPLHVHILEPNYSVYSIKRHDIAQQRYISFLPIAHFSTIRFKKLVKLFFHSPTYFEVSPKLPYTRKRESNSRCSRPVSTVETEGKVHGKKLILRLGNVLLWPTTVTARRGPRVTRQDHATRQLIVYWPFKRYVTLLSGHVKQWVYGNNTVSSPIAEPGKRNRE